MSLDTTCLTDEENGVHLKYYGDFNELCSKESAPILNVDSFALFGRPSFLRTRWWDKKRRKTFSWIGKIVCMLLYIAYMVYAIWYDSGNAFLLLFDTCIVSLWIAAHAERSRKLFIIAGKKIVKANRTVNTKIPYLRIIFTVTVVLVLLVFLIHEWIHDTRQLIPFGGLILLLFLTLLTSRSPSKIKWTPVIWGILLQFLFGLIILRWPIGYGFFQFIAGQISAFLSYTDNASKIVFGEEGIKEHPIVFKAESSIALKPFLKDVSRSGLNSVMTGGFATIACTYIAAYIEFGVPAQHLVAASFMSAPAALAVAKLGWPEDSHVEEIDLSNLQLDVGYFIS